MARVILPAVQDFSRLHSVQTDSGAGTVCFNLGGAKWQGCEADHSPPYSTEVENTWIYTHTPTYAFMAYGLSS
jgi:hypothetical protein